MNETHDPRRRSWVESANEPSCEFPVQNLPFGVFRRKGSGEQPRAGVAIGESIADLAPFARAAGFRGKSLAAVEAAAGPNLNELAALGRPFWRALRKDLSRALALGADADTRRRRLSRHLVPMATAELSLPVAVGDFSDFYTGIHHATNVGRIFRPDNPLLPNYKWVPIGYHGRASSVVVSGMPVVRPNGQTKAPDAAAPAFGPCKRLDYEVELGFVIGPGNALGTSFPIRRALDHVFGVLLLNDWSARDIQTWEYQPLGPFLAKSFATTISPWIVTLEALEPFRCAAFARGADDPGPLPYLYDETDQREGGYAIELEMHLRSARMRKQKLAPMRLSRGSSRDSYWTAAQIITHQASNGCNLNPGDLLGSGTISGTTPDSFGSLLELTQGGRQPVQLPTGETRTFIENGDELIERGRCVREDCVSIGFGEAAGLVKPAPRP